MLRFSLMLLTIVLASAGCRQGDSSSGGSDAAKTSPGTSKRIYQVKGIIRGYAADRDTVTIEHEAIPGFMPAMTMPFYIRQPAELSAFKPGDAVAFDFVVTESNSWATDFRSIASSAVELPDKTAAGKPTSPGGKVQRIKEGDPMPELELLNSEGEPITKDSFEGETVLLSFIFTRCPVPNFCPLITQNFKTIHKTLQEEPAIADQVRLLSISIDPEYDRPDVLKKYKRSVAGADVGADAWTFATGTTEEIDRLTTAFRVYVKEDSETINHGLCTALISPQGTIDAVWRGNKWEPKAVLKAIKATVSDK